MIRQLLTDRTFGSGMDSGMNQVRGRNHNPDPEGDS
jgi:hypothetical protein